MTSGRAITSSFTKILSHISISNKRSQFYSFYTQTICKFSFANFNSLKQDFPKGIVSLESIFAIKILQEKAKQSADSGTKDLNNRSNQDVTPRSSQEVATNGDLKQSGDQNQDPKQSADQTSPTPENKQEVKDKPKEKPNRYSRPQHLLI